MQRGTLHTDFDVWLNGYYCEVCEDLGELKDACIMCGGTGRELEGERCLHCHGFGYTTRPCGACDLYEVGS